MGLLTVFTKNKYNITEAEKKKYALPKRADKEILVMCKELEKMNLSAEEKNILKLIKSQLERDWRKPLIKRLNQLIKKYRLRPIPY